MHAISHHYSEHTSIIKLINEIFGLKPLELLPDEKHARTLGKSEFNQDNLTPFDADPSIGDLSEAFDNARLSGTAKPLPAEYAAIPATAVLSLPHYGGQGCARLNISPTDYVGGALTDPPPADFNPRPSSTPGTPTTPGWPG